MTATQTETILRGYTPEPRIYEKTGVETTLTDSYTIIVTADINEWPDTKIVTITNTDDANALKYSIYATNQETPEDYDWVTLVGSGGAIAEQTVNAETSDYQNISLGWRQLQVKCKNSVGAAVASVRVKIRTVLKTA